MASWAASNAGGRTPADYAMVWEDGAARKRLWRHACFRRAPSCLGLRTTKGAEPALRRMPVSELLVSRSRPGTALVHLSIVVGGGI